MRRRIPTLVAVAALAAPIVAASSATAAPAVPTGLAQFEDGVPGGRGLVSVQTIAPRRLAVTAILTGLSKGTHALSLARSARAGAARVRLATVVARTSGATLTVRRTITLSRALPLKGAVLAWQGPDVDATRREVASETLVLRGGAQLVGPNDGTRPDALVAVWRTGTTLRAQALVVARDPATRHVLGFYSLPEVGDEVLLFANRFTTDVSGTAFVQGALKPVRQAGGKAPRTADVGLLAIAGRSARLLRAAWSFRGGITHDGAWTRVR